MRRPRCDATYGENRNQLKGYAVSGCDGSKDSLDNGSKEAELVLLGSEELEGVDGRGNDLVDNGDDALRVIVGDWASRSLHKRS